MRAMMVALIGASALTACSAASTPGATHSANRAPQPAVALQPAHTSDGLAYSTASGEIVQPMPAPGSCRYRGSGLFAEPDPRCTPGARNPAVTQATIGQTICRPGGSYSASVRPPANVTEIEKRADMAAYSNIAPLASVEEDHAVALSLGGAVNDPQNLWPEPDIPGASAGSYDRNPKDVLERILHDLVCRGKLSLGSAQRAIAADWASAYRTYVR